MKLFWMQQDNLLTEAFCLCHFVSVCATMIAANTIGCEGFRRDIMHQPFTLEPISKGGTIPAVAGEGIKFALIASV